MNIAVFPTFLPCAHLRGTAHHPSPARGLTGHWAAAVQSALVVQSSQQLLHIQQAAAEMQPFAFSLSYSSCSSSTVILIWAQRSISALPVSLILGKVKDQDLQQKPLQRARKPLGPTDCKQVIKVKHLLQCFADTQRCAHAVRGMQRCGMVPVSLPEVHCPILSAWPEGSDALQWGIATLWHLQHVTFVTDPCTDAKPFHLFNGFHLREAAQASAVVPFLFRPYGSRFCSNILRTYIWMSEQIRGKKINFRWCPGVAACLCHDVAVCSRWYLYFYNRARRTKEMKRGGCKSLPAEILLWFQTPFKLSSCKLLCWYKK